MSEITMSFVLKMPPEFMVAIERLTNSIDRLAHAASAEFVTAIDPFAGSSDQAIVRDMDRIEVSLDSDISADSSHVQLAPAPGSETQVPTELPVSKIVAEPVVKPAVNPEEVSKPIPAAAAPKQEKTWTAERDDQLVRQKLAGMDFGDILLGLNTLAGPEIKSEAACKTRYYSLQSTGYKLSNPKPAAKPAAVSALKLNADGEQTVPYDYARQWASERGLVGRNGKLDLQVVNAKRKALNLPPFAITQGRVRAL